MQKIENENQLNNLLEQFKTVTAPLEIVHFMQEKKLNKDKIENLIKNVRQLFGFRIDKRLTNIKLSSHYGKKHIGLLLQHLTELKWKVYDATIKKDKQLNQDLKSHYNFKQSSILYQINNQEGFLSSKSEEILHIAAVLCEEITELLS